MTMAMSTSTQRTCLRRWCSTTTATNDEVDPRLIALSILLDPKRSSAMLSTTRTFRDLIAEERDGDKWQRMAA